MKVHQGPVTPSYFSHHRPLETWASDPIRARSTTKVLRKAHGVGPQHLRSEGWVHWVLYERNTPNPFLHACSEKIVIIQGNMIRPLLSYQFEISLPGKVPLGVKETNLLSIIYTHHLLYWFYILHNQIFMLIRSLPSVIAKWVPSKFH